jgi:hypothetical protein
VERIWGPRFTFWNVLLHCTDPQFNVLLQTLDAFVVKYRSSYGEKRLRNGMKNDPFSFLSELTVYDLLRSQGLEPIYVEDCLRSDSPSPLFLTISGGHSDRLRPQKCSGNRLPFLPLKYLTLVRVGVIALHGLSCEL